MDRRKISKKEVSIEGELVYKAAEVQNKTRKGPRKVVRKPKITWLNMGGYDLEQFTYDDMPMKLLKPKKDRNNRVVLQLHGGAYIFSLNEDIFQKYRAMARLYSKANGNSDVLTIDYRVAPENTYPAALEDSVKGYNWLLENGYNPEDIIVAGDSAGGGLALATVMYLRDNNIPLPKAVVTMSAWTNLTGNSESMINNFDIDPVFGMNENACEFMYNPSYVGDNDIENPYISPLFGEYKGMPRMLMQVGSIEMLLNDTTDIATKAREAGVDVVCTSYNGMIHDFQIAGSLLPEAENAWEEVAKFIEETYRT